MTGGCREMIKRHDVSVALLLTCLQPQGLHDHMLCVYISSISNSRYRGSGINIVTCRGCDYTRGMDWMIGFILDYFVYTTRNYR
jgi:hypothetical protein